MFSVVSRILLRNPQISLGISWDFFRSSSQDIYNSSSIGNPDIVPRISGRIPSEDLFKILPKLIQRFLLLIFRVSCSTVSTGILTRFETSAEVFPSFFFRTIFQTVFAVLRGIVRETFQSTTRNLSNIFSRDCSGEFFRNVPVFFRSKPRSFSNNSFRSSSLDSTRIYFDFSPGIP